MTKERSIAERIEELQKSNQMLDGPTGKQKDLID